jgi:hypothetical protein
MDNLLDLMTLKNFIDTTVAKGVFKTADEAMKVVTAFNNIAMTIQAPKETNNSINKSI